MTPTLAELQRLVREQSAAMKAYRGYCLQNHNPLAAFDLSIHERLSLANTRLGEALDSLAAAPDVIDLAAKEWVSFHDTDGMEKQPPLGRNVILFAVTDRKEDGSVANWKMDTGTRMGVNGVNRWIWEGRDRKEYETKPTHWMSLPAPPIGQEPS